MEKMNLEVKALYNLLRMNYRDDDSLQVEPWQIKDLRLLSMESLFEDLKSLNLNLTKEVFFNWVDECDSPEELAHMLTDDEASLQDCDRVYLDLFELWRRLVPERRTLYHLCPSTTPNVPFPGIDSNSSAS